MKHLFLLLFATSLQIVTAQSIMMKPFKAKAASDIKAHLSDYTLLSFEPNTIANLIDSKKGNVKELSLKTPDKSWNLQLFEYQLLSPEINRTSGSPSQLQKLKNRKDVRTFNGSIKGISSIVSLTIADGFFSIMIDDRKNRYFIEPLAQNIGFTGIPSNQQFIFYKSSDVIPNEGNLCGAYLTEKSTQDHLAFIQQQDTFTIDSCILCLEVKICLAADYSMFKKYSEDILQTENQMISVLANVQTVFDDEFKNEYFFVITDTYVADVEVTDPWYGINDINAMLTKFSNVANQIFLGVQHNVGTLWTAKFKAPGTVGTAFQSSICKKNKYNVCSDYISQGGQQANYLTLQAHQLGHNFSMNHDTSISKTIMASGLPNGTNIWSDSSVYMLNSYVIKEKLEEFGCLEHCPNTEFPVPDFVADLTCGCAPQLIHFRDLSLHATKWRWYFPGGTPDTSSLQNPWIEYKKPGKHDVTLIAGNDRCEAIITKKGYIELLDLPIAQFTYTYQGCGIFFNDQSLRADNYLWLFGDGEISHEANPYHEYKFDTSYNFNFDTIFNVTLIVSNDCGLDTIEKTVIVESETIAKFTSDTTHVCAPGYVKFSDKSTKYIKEWYWEFSEGQPAKSNQKNPIIQYNLPGTYDVKLKVIGCHSKDSIIKNQFIIVDSLPIADFTYQIDVDKVDFTSHSRYAKSHFWEFGDNTNSTNPNPTHFYLPGTYEVTYVVSNFCGTDTFRTNITIGPKIRAGFTTSSSKKGCAPFQVQYNNTSVLASSFKWYFPGGNPSTSTDINPLISYDTNSSGTYDVSLIATNHFSSDSMGVSDFIEVTPIPTSNFTNTVTGFTSYFTNQSKTGDTYFWEFGDGHTSNEMNPVHNYNVEGEFEVKLTVQNSCGTDIFIRRIAVYLVPKVNFTASVTEGCSPLSVQFVDRSSSDVIEWNWQFENGTPSSSNEQNPLVRFNKKGKHSILLNVKNTNGTNSLTKIQYINILPANLCFEKVLLDKNLLTSDITENPIINELDSRSGHINLENGTLVYPNPAKDYLLIYTQANVLNPVMVEIYNFSGIKLSNYVSKQNWLKIETNKLINGTYLLKLKDQNQTSISKFIISN